MHSLVWYILVRGNLQTAQLPPPLLKIYVKLLIYVLQLYTYTHPQSGCSFPLYQQPTHNYSLCSLIMLYALCYIELLLYLVQL